ncbi:MAG: hypothetical protein VXV91_08805, partial [Verrucomicrobiota bacterium]|nr:hypothetical protein [Verrucomicrobiota bacterium]
SGTSNYSLSFLPGVSGLCVLFLFHLLSLGSSDRSHNAPTFVSCFFILFNRNLQIPGLATGAVGHSLLYSPFAYAAA